MSALRLLFFSLVFIIANSCTNENAQRNTSRLQSANLKVHTKQRGAHVFGHLDSLNIQDLKKNNIEWLTFVPYGSQKDYNTTDLTYHRHDAMYQLRIDSMWRSKIEVAHQAGLKVFLKPHIWLYQPSDSKWRSDIFFDSSTKWKIWSEAYRDFILRYAKLAEDNHIEMYCIGTELTRITLEKPTFWTDLIAEVKKVYSGKLTYAANWYEEYEKITFWDQLDFIGIQAYFPLTKSKNPTLENLSKGWNRFLPTLQQTSQRFNRPILFTELGYKSTSDSAITPWEWIEFGKDYKDKLSLETQSHCYVSFFENVWDHSWFAGAHLWQMRSNLENENHHESIKFDFTPQNKPAMDIITKGFGEDLNQ